MRPFWQAGDHQPRSATQFDALHSHQTNQVLYLDNSSGSEWFKSTLSANHAFGFYYPVGYDQVL